MMTLKEMVEVILDRRDRGVPKPSTPFRLGDLFFPIHRERNLALRYFPQYFRERMTSA
jgi:hypothetical protein